MYTTATELATNQHDKPMTQMSNGASGEYAKSECEMQIGCRDHKYTRQRLTCVRACLNVRSRDAAVNLDVLVREAGAQL